MAVNKAAARRKPLSAQDEKRFLDAVSAGHIEKVRQYLERGANPAADSSRALYFALRAQLPQIAELLILRGARAEDVAKHVFQSLTSHPRPPDWAIELITRNLTPATVPSALLFDSLWHINALRALLRAGADPNVMQQQNYEPLSVLAKAIRNHPPEISIALIDAGASPHWTLSRQWARPCDRDISVLTMACERPGNTPVVRRLLAAGAVVDPSHGVRPLTYALEWKALETVRYLLTQGADPVLADAGRLAMSLKLWAVVPDLLRHGANFETFPSNTTRYVDVPLEILGLLLRAQVRWVLDGFEMASASQTPHPAVPRDTPWINVSAIMLARAALVYPDMQPQKLL